jgi:hypothetical protein
VFGNKGYCWKLGAALALIALLGVYAGIRGDTINPSVGRCLAEPRRWDGARIWVPGARIVSVHDGGYEIRSGIVQIRVAGPAPAPAESRISLIAVFRSHGPVLEPVHTRILPAGERLRLVMEIVSVLVTLAVLANFAGHFLFRPKNLQAQGAVD